MSRSLLADYKELEGRVLEALSPELGEADFEMLALEIHRFQRRHNAPYAAWCARKPMPARWQEIPAVPQAMFKRFRLSCLPPELVTKVFRTSGTTGETRGEHHLRDTRLYEAAVLAGWRQVHAPAKHVLFLAPLPSTAPDSSLLHMFDAIALHQFGHGLFFCDASGRLNIAAARQWFTEVMQPGETVALFGTALSFLNLFESLGDERIRLAEGSYALETGGFKGSGRAISKADLYARFEKQLGLPAQRVWNEYGMCELASQLYASGLNTPHRGGPWVRAQVISPHTGEEVAIGETGVLRVFDLANVGSVLAIHTSDVAIRMREGFMLLGRDPAAIPRGCSRAADEAMRGATVKANHPAKPEGPPSSAEFPSLGSTRERATVLAQAGSAFPFLGDVTPESLLSLVRLELGHEEALDRFVPYGKSHTRAKPLRQILHILSGNTPAAALQTLIRGLLLGSWNRCKLPSTGLPEVEHFIARLPSAWRSTIETSTNLPDAWLAEADAIVVYGSDETIAHFRGQLRHHQAFVPRGHKLSFGIVFEDPQRQSAAGAARDASVFNQQGCLSPTVFFVRESPELTVEAYAERLSSEMENYAVIDPPAALTLSEANAIHTLREETGFRIANGEPLKLFVGAGTTWTVITDRTPGFPTSPLNRVVFVKPLTFDAREVLAPLRGSISTIGIWPSTAENAEFAAAFGVHRICPVGTMQLPPLTWHHDGMPVLAPLVQWIDWET